MSTSVLYMSMSLDGYIAGPNDEVGNPGGDGFDLHAWFSTPEGKFFRPSGPAGEVYDEGSATGAVLIGRRLAEQIDHWAGTITVVSPSSSSVIGHLVPRSPTI